MTSPTSRPRRGIYLLPNLFTTSALCAGFYAIIAALNGEFANAAISTALAMILDGLDGRVARMTQTSSQFGAEYDSMADMVSFGVGPAMVIYLWSLHLTPELGLRQLGWLVAFVYTACAGLRLARFNVQVGSADKRFFQGLASPSAAALVVSFVWSCERLGISGESMLIPSLIVTLVSGLLMVSNFAYYSFKDFDIRNRLPFVAAVVSLLILVLVTLHPPGVLLVFFAIYAASGPAMSGWRLIRKKRR